MAQIFGVVLSLSVSGALVGLIILLIRPVTRKIFSKKMDLLSLASGADTVADTSTCRY